ncbi:MAG: FIST C-terminal domain-containing protein [Candidatus Sabulitectum sp.]|nr:FIST C-terminal domain-containing protein [Candidatus Sabulitectum sp.]
MLNGLYTRRAEVSLRNEQDAVAELASKLHMEKMGAVIFFCSADYDLMKLGTAIDKTFSCPVVGCTTAGEICSTYGNGGIVAVSFSSEAFRFHSLLIERLHEVEFETMNSKVHDLEESLEFSKGFDPEKMFGFLLIDGLSIMEETVTAALYSALRGVSIIGGSAGDSLKFKETSVFANGRFVTNAAVLTIVETLLPFKTFKLQHFVPSDKEMVITEADSFKRIVYEIDGGPAAEEYAEIIGLKAEELTSQIFAMYPVMLQIGDDWYVRSIEKVNDDGSLTFFCAIDNGLPLTVAEGVGLVETLKEKVEEIQREFPSIELTLGYDCILRRLEINEKNKSKEVEAELNKINFIGFSTFGEQFNSIHVNQTLTGVVFGSELQA